MAKVQPPIFIPPKKRGNVRKQTVNSAPVDHIISVHGNDSEATFSTKSYPLASEEICKGALHLHNTMEGIKSNMKINLPTINDQDEAITNHESTDVVTIKNKNGYQPLNCISSSRDMIDLSPIYEQSSDACSSHGDNYGDTLKSGKSDNTLETTKSLSQSETSIETDGRNSTKRKKRVNISFDIVEQMDTSEMANLQNEQKDGYLTMSGTIKRGKKKGENVDVTLNISREELELIEAAIVSEDYEHMDVTKCSKLNGLHVFIFSILMMPFAFIITAFYSFYIGTITWYNIFTYFTEHKCLLKRAFAPIVFLLYPITIMILTINLSLYASVIQITFSGGNWWKEICDLEKGFYGWLCSKLKLSECSPYEVVILTDIRMN